MMDGSGTTETNRAAPGALAEIGLLLRRRREEVGQDIAAISAITHIKPHFLKAIEEGRRKDLPGTAYMIGYIRTYANHLGLDGNRLITDYHDELAAHRHWVDKRAEPAEPAGLSRMRISPIVALAGLAILGIAAYVGWGYATAPRQETAETATVEERAEPATPEPVAAAEPATGPAVPSPTGANASAPSAAGPDPAGTMSAVTDDPPPPTDIAPAASEAAPGPTIAEALPGSEAGPEASAENEAEDQVPPEADLASTGDEAVEETPPQDAVPSEPEGAPGKIVVRARLESWVQITNAEKQVIFSRVLRAGETYTVPDEEGLMFTTGNAGGVELLVDGTKLKSLGTVGLVKRDIPLDARKLIDGTAFQRSRAATVGN
jgi:cytoskeleton protein RodZ